MLPTAWFALTAYLTRVHDEIKSAYLEFEITPEMPVIYMMGDGYYSSRNTESEAVTANFLREYRSVPWFTYREGLEPFPDTSLTSDARWGCTIRATQMATAYAMISLRMGAGWRSDWETQAVVKRDVETLFQDTPLAPLGIYRIVSQSTKRKAGEWFSPGDVAASVLKLTREERGLLEGTGILSFNNGDLVRDRVLQALHEHRDGLIIYLPVRLGVDQVDASFNQDILDLFALPVFRGLVGGELLSRSFYFVAASCDHLYYLDPHFLHPIRNSVDHPPYVSRMRWSLLNPSMMLVFALKDIDEFDNQVMPALLNSRHLNAHFRLFESESEEQLAAEPEPLSDEESDSKYDFSV
jgi:hypothetical protein